MTRRNRFLLIACLGALGCGCAARTSSARANAPDTAEPTSSNALFDRGRQLLAHGDFDRAEQYLSLSMRSGYPEERAIVPLVRACVAGSRLRSALDHAAPVLRRHPADWRLRYLVAALQLALGHPMQALHELDGVLRTHPGSASAHYLRGVIQSDALGDQAAARESFEAYARLDPRGERSPEVQAWLAEHPRTEAP